MYLARSTNWGHSPGRIEIWKCCFFREGKTGVVEEKPLGARTRTNKNKLNPDMTPSPGILPGPQWWEVSALSTAPRYSLVCLIVLFVCSFVKSSVCLFVCLLICCCLIMGTTKIKLVLWHPIQGQRNRE